MSQRLTTLLTGLIAAGAATIAALPAQAQDAVKFGWAISKTGPNAGGATISLIPNYEMWVKEVNAAGGLKLGDKRVPITVVEYDDRSSSEEAVRAVERLINQDKVDFLLAPWGTGVNLAVGPVFARAGYPQLATTAVNERAVELGKRWPNSFWFLGQGSAGAGALVEVLSALRKDGKIGTNVAMVSVADGFGIDLSSAGRPLIEKAGFKLVYDKSYPVGTQDMAPIVTEVQRANPDVFIAFSYPPDTLGLTEQSRLLGFNPKVFYTGVGTAFPLYKQRFGANAQGVMGIGGWDASRPELQDYFKRHVAFANREPDRWASPITYASLQMLQQAIEKVGKIDRAAVIKELQTGSFETVVGTMKMKDNVPTNLWWVGQWQDGEFYGIAPATNPGAKAPLFPKPAWTAQ